MIPRELAASGGIVIAADIERDATDQIMPALRAYPRPELGDACGNCHQTNKQVTARRQQGRRLTALACAARRTAAAISPSLIIG